MKKKEVLAALTILLLALYLFSTFASAAIMHRETDIAYKYTFRLPSDLEISDKDITNSLTTFKMDDATGYCITPQIRSVDLTDYGASSDSYNNIPSGLHKMTPEKQKKIELVSVYGWELSARTKRDALYTKVYINELSTDMTVKNVFNVDGTDVNLNDYKTWKSAIDQKISSYWNVNPSFHAGTRNITLGDSISIADANNVLSEYSIVSLPQGLTASISGQDLKVTAAGNFTGGPIKLRRLNPYRGTSIFYFVVLENNVRRQAIVVPRIASPKEAVINFVPLQPKGNFSLRKTDNKGAALSGASFKLLNTNKASVLDFTVGTKTYISPQLEVGTYSLIETKAPDGYALDPAPRELTVQRDKTNNVYSNAPIVNEPQRIRIRVTKTGEENNQLEGVVFSIKKGDDVVSVITTGSNGVAVSQPLPQGTYTITETTAAPGYAKADEVRVNLSGDTSGTAVLTKEIQISNKKILTEISKKDAAEGAELPGAELTLTEKETGAIIESWTSTDKPHVITGLHQGETYVLTETLAPPGYALAQDVEFVVDGANGAVNKVEMIDELTVTEISKKDAVEDAAEGEADGTAAGAELPSAEELFGPKDLPGAELTLSEKKTGAIIESWTSTDKPHVITGLHQGETYVLTETLAPPGYALAQDVEFVVDGANDIVNKVEMIDELTVTEISKKTVADGEELPGAELTLKEKETGAIIESWTSTDKPHVITGLHQGKTYVLTETLAPPGYALAQDVEFVVDGANGTVNKVEMIDELTVTKISKKDAADGEELPGAELTLTEKETGAIIESWTSTDKPHVITGLHQGKTYVLTETLAPPGYALAQDVEFVVDGANGTVNKVEMINVLLPKTGEDSGGYLSGCLLIIFSLLLIAAARAGKKQNPQ